MPFFYGFLKHPPFFFDSFPIIRSWRPEERLAEDSFCLWLLLVFCEHWEYQQTFNMRQKFTVLPIFFSELLQVHGRKRHGLKRHKAFLGHWNCFDVHSSFFQFKQMNFVVIDSKRAAKNKRCGAFTFRYFNPQLFGDDSQRFSDKWG